MFLEHQARCHGASYVNFTRQDSMPGAKALGKGSVSEGTARRSYPEPSFVCASVFYKHR